VVPIWAMVTRQGRLRQEKAEGAKGTKRQEVMLNSDVQKD